MPSIGEKVTAAMLDIWSSAIAPAAPFASPGNRSVTEMNAPVCDAIVMPLRHWVAVRMRGIGTMHSRMRMAAAKRVPRASRKRRPLDSASAAKSGVRKRLERFITDCPKELVEM